MAFLALGILIIFTLHVADFRAIVKMFGDFGLK